MRCSTHYAKDTDTFISKMINYIPQKLKRLYEARTE